MYTGKRVRLRPLQRAFIMAASGEPGLIASWRGAATGSHDLLRYTKDRFFALPNWGSLKSRGLPQALAGFAPESDPNTDPVGLTIYLNRCSPGE
jgi:hypothetical protein